MTAPGLSTVTLRAMRGEPLADERTRETVVAAAHALAERHAVTVRSIRPEPDAITITIEGPRIVAIGLAAELRRLTTRWYAARHGGDPLWGEPRWSDEEEDDLGEAWKFS